MKALSERPRILVIAGRGTTMTDWMIVVARELFYWAPAISLDFI